MPHHETLLTLVTETRRHDEIARGSRSGTATVGGRNMLPVALAESRPDHMTTYTVTDAGVVTQSWGVGYGYGSYGEDFEYS